MVVLVRFGEIALKSRYVRRQFVDALVGNIHEAFAAAERECITSRDGGRIYVQSNDEESAVGILRRVFGIVSVSAAAEANASLEAICREGVSMAAPMLSRGASFAVRARRTGSHPFTSQDVAVALGRAVQDAVEGCIVDLAAPDVEVYVEVRGPRAYIFTEKVPGPGGLPLGTQGKVAAVVEDERDAVAAWMMMKRGCRVLVVCIEGRGEAAQALEPWDPGLRVIETSPEELTAVMEREGVDALVSGLDFPDVASERPGLPAFHPTVGLSSREVSELWESVSSER